MDTYTHNHEEGHTFSIDCQDIILREYIVTDLDAFHSLTWQPEIHEFLPGWNVAKEQREEWLIHYEIPENGQFLKAVAEGGDVGELRLRLGIVLKETGELIGWCASGIKDELPASSREIMYAISRDHRGKGYATQAVQGMVKYLFAHTKVEVLNAIALLINLPSNKVIQKSGFQLQGIIEIDNESYNHYRLDRKN
ncbi:GNAT family N-acetyltransferase [Paenibacillus sp. NPDC058177]|uniref:GNAT family N-acetyltransferase n=1 Tax=Paenibacillus sp. NPDC058177 TaxID=3346369 RepID=UPI0036D7DACF